ncbi:VanW family protein [Planococcus maritimus]|uniref:VanW family protein n=1 Tax=Planococcus maritimus TaxID=192421 RepID=UPI00313926E8
MDNKVFGLTFLAVLASAMVFFGIANAGSYAIDNILFSTDEFGDNTYIGATDVSNMEVASAVSTLSNNFEEWKQSATLLVQYQDAAAEYPLKHAAIRLDELTAETQSGQQNNLLIELPESKTRSFLAENFPGADFPDIDVQNITSSLEAALAAGQTETRIDISNDALSLNKTIVSETSFPHSLKSEEADAVIQALNGMAIAPGSQFSLLNVLTELDVWEISDKEMTEIASSIYASVLKTNLLVDERSIGTTQPKMVPLGLEAAINQELDIDLAFTNPNNSTFVLNLNATSKDLTASLSALPLVYDYSLLMGSKTEVAPRLIKQYSAFVSKGKSVKEQGADGVRIEVSRAISDEVQEIELEAVSTDFYPPVHRVEVYPLESTETDSEENPDVEQPEESLIVEDPENPGFDMSGNPIILDEEGEIVQNDSPVGSTDDEEGNGEEQSTEAIYDKGGNLIKP